MEKITSLDNQKIKDIIKLRKARERKKKDLIVIEGKKEIELALTVGVEILDIFYCETLSPHPAPPPQQAAGEGTCYSSVDEDKEVSFSELGFDEDLLTLTNVSVFKKISYRDKPDGFLALAKPMCMELKDLQLSDRSVVIVLEAVEKPGNLGAILRSADASGVDAIIINDEKTDIFNPNVIRASRGTVFTVPVVSASREETIKFLKLNKIRSYATALSSQKNYTEFNYKESTAIVLGTEDKGLSQEWVDSADEFIKIPMRGEIDSLNVSVSAGVIMYEILRQRGL